jgi:hypothetical protein
MGEEKQKKASTIQEAPSFGQALNGNKTTKTAQ